MENRLRHVAELATLAPTTVHNLFRGVTRKPQNATAMAIATALNFERYWKDNGTIDIEAELKLARLWNKRHERKRKGKR
jgi:hypothetical protein